MHHIEIPADIYSYPNACNHFESACIAFRESGACTFDECNSTKLSKKWPKVIYYGIERAKNGEAYTLNNGLTDGTSIAGQLFISPDAGKADSEKIIQKMRTRSYTRSPIEITKNTDFREHIIWPE